MGCAQAKPKALPAAPSQAYYGGQASVQPAAAAAGQTAQVVFLPQQASLRTRSNLHMPGTAPPQAAAAAPLPVAQPLPPVTRQPAYAPQAQSRVAVPARPAAQAQTSYPAPAAAAPATTAPYSRTGGYGGRDGYGGQDDFTRAAAAAGYQYPPPQAASAATTNALLAERGGGIQTRTVVVSAGRGGYYGGPGYDPLLVGAGVGMGMGMGTYYGPAFGPSCECVCMCVCMCVWGGGGVAGCGTWRVVTLPLAPLLVSSRPLPPHPPSPLPASYPSPRAPPCLARLLRRPRLLWLRRLLRPRRLLVIVCVRWSVWAGRWKATPRIDFQTIYLPAPPPPSPAT